jgi:hypothetical protein
VLGGEAVIDADGGEIVATAHGQQANVGVVGAAEHPATAVDVEEYTSTRSGTITRTGTSPLGVESVRFCLGHGDHGPNMPCQPSRSSHLRGHAAKWA